VYQPDAARGDGEKIHYEFGVSVTKFSPLLERIGRSSLNR
jgi:hypothetical protein